MRVSLLPITGMVASAAAFAPPPSAPALRLAHPARAGAVDAHGPTMAATKCGINGFGRIGRLVARIMYAILMYLLLSHCSIPGIEVTGRAYCRCAVCSGW